MQKMFVFKQDSRIRHVVLIPLQVKRNEYLT